MSVGSAFGNCQRSIWEVPEPQHSRTINPKHLSLAISQEGQGVAGYLGAALLSF